MRKPIGHTPELPNSRYNTGSSVYNCYCQPLDYTSTTGPNKWTQSFPQGQVGGHLKLLQFLSTFKAVMYCKMIL